jgi:hypothetical protein
LADLLSALSARVEELERALKPFYGIVGPFRAATETGRHYIPDEAFRAVHAALSPKEAADDKHVRAT